MGCRIAEDKRRRVKVKLDLDKKSKEISKETNVSSRSVQRFGKNLRDYGRLTPPKNGPQGRPRVISPEMEEVYFPLVQNSVQYFWK